MRNACPTLSWEELCSVDEQKIHFATRVLNLLRLWLKILEMQLLQINAFCFHFPSAPNFIKSFFNNKKHIISRLFHTISVWPTRKTHCGLGLPVANPYFNGRNFEKQLIKSKLNSGEFKALIFVES